MSERFAPGPHPAIIPMLLAMSQDQENFEKTLDDLIHLIQSTKNAMQAMRTGMETFHTGMLKIAHPPAGQFNGPFPPKPEEASTKPVKEEGPPFQAN